MENLKAIVAIFFVLQAGWYIVQTNFLDKQIVSDDPINPTVELKVDNNRVDTMYNYDDGGGFGLNQRFHHQFRSKKPIDPQIKLVVTNNQVDTQFVYKLEE